MTLFFSRLCVLLALLLSCSVPAVAQVRVDGEIRPAEWEGAQHVTDFRMIQPFTQSPTRHPTEAWILATPEGLAVAFRNTKLPGVATPRQQSRRDQDVSIDRVNVMLDFEGAGRTGYDLTVTASGGIQDATITNSGNFSTDWDGRWEHAVVDAADVWTAELLIPWHTAPMRQAKDGKRRLGIYLDRVVGSLGERMAWPAVTFERPQFLAQFQQLEVPVYSQALLAVTPYGVGLQDLVAKQQQLDAGLDLFWKPNGQFQLSAALNPDFGQVESDALVVNFSAQETFYGDKRPFFTENQGFFDFSLLSENSQLLYTRRVGAMADDGSGPADIRGAIKFNGSVGHTQYGAFFADERGDAGRRFAALRLQREFGAQQWGAMLTSVDRPFLGRTARVGGLDHRWQPDVSLTVASTVVGSDVAVRGQHRRGVAATSKLQKTLQQGWSFSGMLQHVGRDFEVNDAGYLGRNDVELLQFNVGKRITELPEASVYAAHNLALGVELQQNSAGLWLQRMLQWHIGSQRKDGGQLEWGLEYAAPKFDDQLTRSHGAVRRGAELFASVERRFPRRGDWEFHAEGELALGGGLRSGWPVSASVTLAGTYFMSDAVNIELALSHDRSQDMLIWQGDTLGPGYGNVIGSFRTRQAALRSSFNWAVSPRQELRVKLEALGFDAGRPQPWRVQGDGRVLASIDPVQAFNLRHLGFQIRYRYELAPLSNLYVVYGRGGFAQEAFAGNAFNQLQDAFALRDDEQLVVKLAYRFEL